MSNENEQEEFRSELIDEQIDQLLQDNPVRSLESRLSHELQDHYIQDAHSLAKVWERLELSSDLKAAERESVSGDTDYKSKIISGLHTYARPQNGSFHEGMPPMQTRKSLPLRGHTTKRTLALTAAVIVTAVLVGSMLLAINAIRQQNALTPPRSSSSITGAQAGSSALYIGNANGLVKANAETGKVIWRYQIPTDSNSNLQSGVVQVLPAGKFVYELLDMKQIMAFDAANGHVLWTFQAPTATNMALENKTLYLSASDYQANKSSVSALNAETGTLLSMRFTLSGSPSSLSLVEHVLYVATNANISAINTANNQQIWQKSIADLGFGTNNSSVGFSIAHGTLYATLQNGHFAHGFALKASNGTILWQTGSIPLAGSSGGGTGITAPVVGNNLVYFATLGFSGAVFAYDAQKGSQIWTHKTGSAIVQTTPVFSHNTLYITEDTLSLEGAIPNPHPTTKFVALNGNTGHISWQSASAQGISTSTFVLNGVVYVTTAYPKALSTAYTYAFEASTGASLWKSDLGKDPLSVVGTN